MTASTAFWAYGSKLQLGNGAGPEVFAAIVELSSITPPGMSRDDIDITHLNSDNGYREFIPGFRDGGEVECEGNWLPGDATQGYATGLWSNFNDNLLHNWKILLPDGVHFVAFSGYVNNYSPELPMEEQATVSFTIKVSGKPTYG